MFSSYTSPRVGTKSFSLVQNAFLQADDLPFRDVLTEEEIHAAFVAENACFGEDEDDIYTPALTLWGWLAQVMHAEKARSCVAAVARITALCVALGRKPPSPDTGTYCRARAKLPEPVLRRLVYTVGDELESRVPADWLWLGRHVKIGDGTTLLTPDTDANQAVWPQPRTQKPGLGFPILRMVVLLSLATAALCGLAIGPYKGKETGEPALLRELLDRFQRGDVFLGDCAYCSYFMLALLLGAGRGRGDASTPVPADRLPLRAATGQRGPRGGLGAAGTAGVDGRGNLCHDPRDAHRARVESPRGRAGLPRPRVGRRHHADRCGALPAGGDRPVVSPSLARGTRSAEHQDQSAAGRSSREDAGDDPPRDLGPLAGLQSDPQGDGPDGAASREVAAGIEFRQRAGGRHRRVGAGQRGRCVACCPCMPKRNTAASPGPG